ncbi:hypothetical protein ACX0G7_01610 [Flavitalea antarctica]
MKTVIVPSNRNAAFVDRHSVIAEAFPGEMIHYIFLDIRPVPDSYNDLIMISRNREHRAEFNSDWYAALAEFTDAVKDCKVSVDHIYGDSAPVFRNYFEHRGGDLVIFDQSQWLSHPHFKESDIFQMVVRSGASILYIPSSGNSYSETPVRINVTRTPKGHLVSGKELTGAGRSTTVAAHDIQTLAPASVRVQYNSVDKMLSDLQSQVFNQSILVRKISRVGRYFMKPSTVHRMLAESKRDMLWLK